MLERLNGAARDVSRRKHPAPFARLGQTPEARANGGEEPQQYEHAHDQALRNASLRQRGADKPRRGKRHREERNHDGIGFDRGVKMNRRENDHSHLPVCKRQARAPQRRVENQHLESHGTLSACSKVKQ